MINTEKTCRLLTGFALLTIVFLLVLSCSDNTPVNMPETGGEGMVMARGIIYDVIIKPQSQDDEWEQERLEGYNGGEMIDRIFESVYNGKVRVYDYHTGAEMNPGEIRRMEQAEGNDRSNIGKIQFTENWYFDPASLQLEKEIISMVPGYESRSSDGTFVGYRAAFRLDLKSGEGSLEGL